MGHNYVVYGEAYAAAEGVSQQEAMQRGAELQRFSASAPPHCVTCRWLTSLGRKPLRIQRSLAVEANSALPPGAILHCLVDNKAMEDSRLSPREQVVDLW